MTDATHTPAIAKAANVQSANVQSSPESVNVIFAKMFTLVVARNGTAKDAKTILVNWFNSLPEERKQEFKSDFESTQSVLKRCEGTIDMIRQETQMLMHRFEQR